MQTITKEIRTEGIGLAVKCYQCNSCGWIHLAVVFRNERTEEVTMSRQSVTVSRPVDGSVFATKDMNVVIDPSEVATFETDFPPDQSGVTRFEGEITFTWNHGESFTVALPILTLVTDGRSN